MWRSTARRPTNVRASRNVPASRTKRRSIPLKLKRSLDLWIRTFSVADRLFRISRHAHLRFYLGPNARAIRAGSRSRWLENNYYVSRRHCFTFARIRVIRSLHGPATVSRNLERVTNVGEKLYRRCLSATSANYKIPILKFTTILLFKNLVFIFSLYKFNEPNLKSIGTPKHTNIKFYYTSLIEIVNCIQYKIIRKWTN